MASAKYRSYLTFAQLHYFLQLAEADDRSETEALRLRSIKDLKLFIAKNDLGAVTPSYIATGRPTLASRLGLESDTSVETPEERRKLAYDLWCRNPMLVSPDELKLVTLYRYENDLMSPAEETEYEASL